MSTSLHLTVPEYDALVAQGAFDVLRAKRIELIYGELWERTPQSAPLQLTLEEYEQMTAQGIFDVLPAKRIELIFGELRQMSPQGPPHRQAIVYLNRWSTHNTSAEQVEVAVQCPIRVPQLMSEPEPDIVWSRPVAHLGRLPEPHEILLVIEIAGTSLAFDMNEKGLLYAKAGVNDYWVVDLNERCLHIFRQPSPSGFTHHETLRQGSIAPLADPRVTLLLSELFTD